MLEWINILPDYKFADIKKDGNNYSYNYKKETTKNGDLERSVEYTKNDNEEYLGKLTLAFSATEKSYIETIPKSFASHVDRLHFSTQPSRIINPDPVVEFTNISGDLEIESEESINEESIYENLEAQLLEQESKNCEALEGPEMYACILQLVSKYRGSEYLENELAPLNLAELPGAVSNVVFDNNLKKCDYIKDKQERDTCYEYGYQILIGECDALSGKDYRDCVRKTSWQLPSMETRRLFCYHINDEDMYNECQGKADTSVCDEIDNEDQKLICQLNIAKTKSNISACEEIKDTDGRDLCRAMLGIDKQDPRYCDLVKDDYFNGECNLKNAMAKNDKSMCANIKHQASKDICYSYFGLIKQDVDQAMCDDIHEEFLKEMCELVLAMKNKDTEKCEIFTGAEEGTRLLCYLGMAVKHNDAEICSKITNTRDEELQAIAKQSKDACFYQIALNTKNPELCQKIEDNNLKKECIEKLEKPEISLPSLPDWMNCPVPVDAELKVYGNDYGSRFNYVETGNDKKFVGPFMNYSKPDFQQPYHLYCYNEAGEKHGAFKVYDKDGLIKKEGHYKNNEFDQVIKEYMHGDLLSLRTYVNGIANGLEENYCITDYCIKGPLLQTGPNVNGKKNGVWQFYLKGAPTHRSNYINGHGGKKITN